MSDLVGNPEDRFSHNEPQMIKDRIFYRYIKLCDGINIAGDTEFLNDKARAIISCFLSSDVAPRIQVGK